MLCTWHACEKLWLHISSTLQILKNTTKAWEKRCTTGSKRRVVHLKCIDFPKKRAPETIRKQQVNKNHQQSQHWKEVPPEAMVDRKAGQQGHCKGDLQQWHLKSQRHLQRRRAAAMQPVYAHCSVCAHISSMLLEIMLLQ